MKYCSVSLLLWLCLPITLCSAQELQAPDLLPDGWPEGMVWTDILQHYHEDEILIRNRILRYEYRGNPMLIDGFPPGYIDIYYGNDLIHSISRYGATAYINLKPAQPLSGPYAAIIATSGGGSGSRPPQFHILEISEDGFASPLGFLSHPDLKSEDWTSRVATEGATLYFDLGYANGVRRVATYRNGKVDVFQHNVEDAPLSDNTCQDLYQTVQRPYNSSGYQCGYSNAVIRNLHTLDQRPGFSQDDFMDYCAAYHPDWPPYEHFKAHVCSAK